MERRLSSGSGIRKSSRLVAINNDSKKSLNLSKVQTGIRKYPSKSSGEKNRPILINPKCSSNLSNIVGIRKSSRLVTINNDSKESLNLSKVQTGIRKYPSKSSGEKNILNPKCSSTNLSNIVDSICDVEKSQTYKPKLPIWDSKQKQVSNISLKQSRRSSKRLSVQSKEGIYDFLTEFNSCSGNSKDNKIKRKPRNKRPRKKFKSTIKSTLLTTDLTWETLLNKNLPVNKIYKCHSDSKSSRPRAENSHDHVSDSLSFNDEIDDDGGYEASISMDYEVNDTKFVPNLENSDQMLKKPNNFCDKSSEIRLTAPTPKIMGRFLGPTSTPRGDYLENSQVHEPVCVQDDMKICFGFDFSEDYNLGFSPVPRSHQMSIPLMSNFVLSDTGDIDPQPTRFAVPYCSRPPLAQVQNYGQQNSVSKLGCEIYGKQKQKKLQTAPLSKISNFGKKKLGPPIPHVETISPVSIVKTISSVETSNNSMLFDNMEEENIDEDANKCQVLSEVNKNHCQIMRSPEKNFKMPPRKSYSRENLENSKIKFNAALAGYSTTGSDTEASEKEVLRKKVITKRKKKQIPKAVSSIKSSKSYTKNIGKLKEGSGKENLPKKDQINTKNDIHSDSSTYDGWASLLNNHFSEVEDMELVCEQNPKVLESKSTK